MHPTEEIFSIEHDWNPWRGCSRVSPGCDHCPALGKKRGGGSTDTILTRTGNWTAPRTWDRRARDNGNQVSVNVCSLSDWFHEGADPWRDFAWDVVRDCRQLIFQILTKRPERITDHLPVDWGQGYENVWLGVSIESNEYVGRADVLRSIPSRVRFIAAEPLLGPLPDLDLAGIHRLIVGAESGHGRREMNSAWALDLRDRARSAGVTFLLKPSAARLLDRSAEPDGGEQKAPVPAVTVAVSDPTTSVSEPRRWLPVLVSEKPSHPFPVPSGRADHRPGLPVPSGEPRRSGREGSGNQSGRGWAGNNDGGWEEESPLRVRDVLPDAPVPEEAVIPADWDLSPAGILEYAGKPESRVPAPVLVSAILTDPEGKRESQLLAWSRDGKWRQRVVDRITVASGARVLQLANFGLPVTSENAKALVKFLAAFDEENRHVLPRALVSRRLGWQGDGGADGFLWGRVLLTQAGEQAVTDVEAVSPVEWPRRMVFFRGGDDGEEQMAEGFARAGTWEGWRQAVGRLAAYPRAQLAVYASLLPPLLPVLQAPNFVLDYAGPTSGGKTTVLRAAASCWGCPDEREPASVLATWDSTRVWIERASAVLNGLPLILDDTKRGGQGKEIARVVYDMASGRGRGRGTIKGMQRTGRSATVLITSGEAPVTGFTRDGGTRARVLTLWGSPFGRTDQATALDVRELNRGLRDHYGHAGPRFVQFLIENRTSWSPWGMEFRSSLARFAERAGDNPVAGRLAGYFAVLNLCARLAHKALDLPWGYGEPAEVAWNEVVTAARGEDQAAAALRWVCDWAVGHQDQFEGRRPAGRGQPAGGWAGRWDRDSAGDTGRRWTYIGFLPPQVEALLKKAGYEAEAMIRTWKDRGWLLVSDPRKARYRARVAGEKNAWLVAIRRQAVEEVGGIGEGRRGSDPEDGGLAQSVPGRTEPGAD